jgi:small subunit ribosomal protein S27Ae
MAAKKAKKAGVKRGAFFKTEGDRVTIGKRYCPRCGPGFVLAEHQDRTACGRCGYTEFKK